MVNFDEQQRDLYNKIDNLNENMHSLLLELRDFKKDLQTLSTSHHMLEGLVHTKHTEYDKKLSELVPKKWFTWVGSAVFAVLLSVNLAVDAYVVSNSSANAKTVQRKN